MNKKKYQEKLNNELGIQSLNVRFLPEWNKQTIESLEATYKQRESIKHPRHRGDSREVDLFKILNESIPSSIKVAKGYGVNTSSCVSYEQDCLLLNSDTSWSLASGGDISYYPIESILGSIEIKSNLTLGELRKAVLNCISLKKLLYKGLPYDEENEPENKICYSIFAYASNCPLKKIVQMLNEVMSDVPKPLRINMIYVLGEGIIMPGETGLELNHNQIYSKDSFYASVDGLGTDFYERDHTITFQWFIANNIDHCLSERVTRKTPSYCSYVFHPFTIQMGLEKLIKEKDPEQYERLSNKNV